MAWAGEGAGSALPVRPSLPGAEFSELNCHGNPTTTSRRRGVLVFVLFWREGSGFYFDSVAFCVCLFVWLGKAAPRGLGVYSRILEYRDCLIKRTKYVLPGFRWYVLERGGSRSGTF